MPRFLIEVQYDGSAYFGWQRQGDGQISVQEVVEASLSDLFGQPTTVLAAGRTDRGVSARAMPAQFTSETRLRGEELRRAIDFRLPPDVAIRSLREVPEDFHCRYDALGKVYAYRLNNARRRAPLARFALLWPRALDFELMHQASRALIGTHDFSSFATLLSEHPNKQTTQPDPDNPDKPQGNVRTIHEIATIRRGEIVSLLVFGDGFLRGMVRAVVGTLLEVATKQREASEVATILAARDRRLAGPNVPAHGLMLERVFYEDAERERWIARAREAATRPQGASDIQWPEELF
ncbi:MAG: tRNA pseudouridine(38-40) synthase TruA [Planctomycetes bacterium]|nr:tRNA pseudouridine(38-40) synthase TruA [Planctomycetota bacterium]